MFPVLFFALCREFMYLLAGVVFYSHGTSRRPLSSRIRPFLCGFHGVRHRSLEATGLGFSRTGSWPSEGTSGAWAPDGGFETHKDKETNRLGTVPELLNSIRFGITFVALKLEPFEEIQEVLRRFGSPSISVGDWKSDRCSVKALRRNRLQTQPRLLRKSCRTLSWRRDGKERSFNDHHVGF